MESLVSLEGCEPELREYLERHRWPSVMEVMVSHSPLALAWTCMNHATWREKSVFFPHPQALLTGLTVMTPRDPWQFVCQSIMHIRDASVTDIPRYVQR